MKLNLRKTLAERPVPLVESYDNNILFHPAFKKIPVQLPVTLYQFYLKTQQWTKLKKVRALGHITRLQKAKNLGLILCPVAQSILKKITGCFPQPFSEVRRIFSSTTLDHSADGHLLGMGNTDRAQENHLEDREWQLPLILRCLMQLGPKTCSSNIP